MIKAFKRFGCFVFEAEELEKIRDLLVKAEIDKLIEVRLVDERYPYIYIAVIRRRGIERECLSRVEALLAKGSISQNYYKKYKRELIEQCINSLEREKSREIVEILERYLSKITIG